MNTLNKDKLLELAEQAGAFEGLNDDDMIFPVVTLEHFASLLSAAQEEREPYGYAYRYPDTFGNGTVLRFNDGCDVNGARPIEAVPYYFSTPSSNQAWNEAVEAAAKICDVEHVRDDLTGDYRHGAGICAYRIRSLKRPLQAQEPECNGQCFKCECGRMPTQADPSASGAADSQPSPVTDEWVDDIAEKETGFEAGDGVQPMSPDGMRRIVRTALSRAQSAPDEVQAAEAKLYRDLTGDAMAMGYDGIPAALEALRAQVAQHAQAAPFGIYVERTDGTKEFRRTGEVFSPSPHGGKAWALYAAPVSEQPAAQSAQTAGVPDGFDAWLTNPYTKALQKSIAEDYVPKYTAAPQPVAGQVEIALKASAFREASALLSKHGAFGLAKAILEDEAERIEASGHPQAAQAKKEGDA